MAYGHGGRRLGAGRKPGSPTNRRREVIDKAADAGITPLELQLATMRELWRRAHAHGDMDVGLATQACQIAKDCAPYVHPRLAAVEAKVDTQVEVKITQEERRRQARAEIDAAFAEVRSERNAEVAVENAQLSEQRHNVVPNNDHGEPAFATEGPALPLPREFAREGQLALAPDVARLPTRYRPPRTLGNWSG